jgi:two-component sensor histidine kinase
MRWQLTGGTERPRMSLVYEETDGPSVDAPTHRGFGSRLFSASFSSPEDGSIVIDYPVSGARCTIEMSGVVAG